MTAKRSRNGGGGNGKAAVVNGAASRIVAVSTREIVVAGGLSIETFCDFAEGLSMQAVVLQQSGAEMAFCGISSCAQQGMREQKPITAPRGASPTTRSSIVITAIFRIMIYKVLRA